MVGQPGTGKTLLGRLPVKLVPFFSISGSDFVEMFVGGGLTGSGHVRAGQSAPSSSSSMKSMPLSSARAGLGGGHDEREQTPKPDAG